MSWKDDFWGVSQKDVGDAEDILEKKRKKREKKIDELNDMMESFMEDD